MPVRSRLRVLLRLRIIDIQLFEALISFYTFATSPVFCKVDNCSGNYALFLPFIPMLRVLFSADKENAEPEQMQNTTLRKIKAMKSHSIHGFYIETAAKIRIFRSFRFRSCYFRRIIVTREILSSQPDTETFVVIFPSLAGVILMSMRHPLSACSLHKKTLQFGAQTAVVSGLRHLIPSWFPPS